MLAVGLSALVAGVQWWPWIAVVDARINDFFAAYRSQPFLAGFVWLTAFGANPTVVAVCATTSALLWVARLPGLMLPLWIAFLGAQATGWSLKFLVGRTRPAFLEVASAISPSFPSGHSLGSIVVYGFLAFVLARHGPRGTLAIAAPAMLVALVLLIGFSRMFLSVHYASDVLGGFLVGGLWLLVAIALSERTTA
ncbi:MAG: phosphatase PAP2 family protein [Enhydrobacter sp.]|nr:phosphatase PAP2 family protein [Enhydrobacter sp.]